MVFIRFQIWNSLPYSLDSVDELLSSSYEEITVSYDFKQIKLILS